MHLFIGFPMVFIRKIWFEVRWRKQTNCFVNIFRENIFILLPPMLRFITEWFTYWKLSILMIYIDQTKKGGLFFGFEITWPNIESYRYFLDLVCWNDMVHVIDIFIYIFIYNNNIAEPCMHHNNILLTIWS